MYQAFPIDPRWQLLTRRWDIAKFLDVPHCRYDFFKEELKIHSRDSGRLVAKDGECNVELSSITNVGLVLSYELFYDRDQSGHGLSTSLQIDNYVLINREHSKWNFVIRFPEAGVYILKIFGGRKEVHQSDSERTECVSKSEEVNYAELCVFRIDCNEPKSDCKPLPFNPGEIGYGPSIDTELAGLKALSHRTGIVKLFVREPTEFRFKITKDVTVRSKLVHSTDQSTTLEQYCQQNLKNTLLTILVTMPESGEYALVIHTKYVTSTSTFENACNYLLTSESKTTTLRQWEVSCINMILNERVLNSVR